MEISHVSSWKAPHNNKIQDHSQNFENVQILFPVNPNYLHYFNQIVDSFWKSRHNTTKSQTNEPILINVTLMHKKINAQNKICVLCTNTCNFKAIAHI